MVTGSSPWSAISRAHRPGTLPTVFNLKSWTGLWTAPPQRVGKIGFYAAGNGANGSGSTSGDYIYTGSTSTLSGSALSNFDSDQASELAVFRPSTGAWYSFNVSSGAVQGSTFGLPGDRIAPGDYDGDGRTDLAVFRPSTGTWYVQRSSLDLPLHLAKWRPFPPGVMTRPETD